VYLHVELLKRKKMYTKLLMFLFLSLIGFAQEKPAYVIYTKDGKKTTYSKMVKSLEKKKLVFFGELHDNPIAHWLQLELLNDFYKTHQQQMSCGSEMYEQDNQAALNAYLNGTYDLKKFKDSCRLWPNQHTDYQPLLDFCKENHIPWVASNIPRKYASLVYKKGVVALDTLSATEKTWLCPLPFTVDTTLSQYKALTEGEMHMGKNFVYAQAIKDATMGYFISQQLKKYSFFYHLNGSYHSDYFQGILWYVNHYAQVDFAEMGSISTVLQKDISKLESEYLGKADFIICVPENMTSTH
jgi:uncharacterized iron-regulated protein